MIDFFRIPERFRRVEVERLPLEFAPDSTSTLNQARLNARDPAYWGLSLRFRPSPATRAEIADFSRSLRQAVLLAAFLIYVPPIVQITFGTTTTVIVFGILPTLSVLVDSYFGRSTAMGNRLAIAGWLVVVYALAVEGLDQQGKLFPDVSPAVTARPGIRGIGFSILAFPLMGVALWNVLQALVAHIQFVKADPSIPAEPRKSYAPGEKRPFKSYFDLRDTGEGIAIIFAFVATFLALIAAASLPPDMSIYACAVLLLTARKGFSDFPRMSHTFFNYDLGSATAPGLWRPAVSAAMFRHQSRRRWSLFFALLGLHFAFATATYWGQLRSAMFQDRPSQIEAKSVFQFVQAAVPAAPQSTASDRVPRTFKSLGMTGLVSVESIITSCIFVYGFAGLWLIPFLREEKKWKQKATGRPEQTWKTYTDRLRSSAVTLTGVDGEQIRERDHLYLGHEPAQQFPILLHRSLLSEHCHILGDSGSGKTSLGLIPILTQLLDRDKEQTELDKLTAIVVLDLKGDMALFETARLGDGTKPARFRFFTPEPRRSHIFNPFTTLKSSSTQSKIQIAQLFLEALALNHGEGYGRSYYSKRSRDLMLYAMEKSNATNFDELYEFLNRAINADPQRFREAFELVATIKALTYYRQLITSPNQPVRDESLILMDHVLERRQVVYFWLPSAIESVSVREIGKLALYSLVSEALARRAAGKPTVPTYLFIDEFQRIAGENFKVILQQARSLGISVILANQSMADLRTPAADLRSTVRTNTRAKMYFSVQDSEEVQELSAASGLDAVSRQSFSSGVSLGTGFLPQPIRTAGVTASFDEKPRLTESDIREISDHPRRFVLHVSRGSGLSQFGGRALPVETTFSISREEYDSRSNAPWPDDPTAPSFATAPLPREVDNYVDREMNQNFEAAILEAFNDGRIAEGLGGMER